MTRTVTFYMVAMLLCVPDTRAHRSMAGKYDATRRLTAKGTLSKDHRQDVGQ